MSEIEFRVIVLPDDRRLTPGATRARTVSGSHAWKRGRFTPRSVTKDHQHHLLTSSRSDAALYFEGQGK